METTFMNYVVLGLLAAVLLICSVTDLRSRKIYNVVTFSAIAAIVLIRIFHHPQGLIMYVWGIVPAVLFLMMAILSKGKAMGGGDILLILFIGLSVGIIGTVMSVIYSLVLSALFLTVRYVLANKKGTVLPMAPFLTLGIVFFYLQPYWLAPMIKL